MPRTKHFARRVLQRICTPVAVRVRNAVNVGWKWRKSGFVRMSFAGERQSHQGAPMEGVLKRDYSWAFRVCAGDLDSVFHGFGAGIHEQRFLRKIAGRDLI